MAAEDPQTEGGKLFIQTDLNPQPGDAILDLGCGTSGTGELSANDPGPQMIPKLDRKWSRTGNDPHIGPQMIPIKK